MIFFHIGFPKSASSTLQKQLFDKHSQINFLGVYPTANIGKDTNDINTDSHYLKSDELKEFHNCLTNMEGIIFKYSNARQLYLKVRTLLKANIANVFSNERFTSVLFAHKDRAEKARRIKEFFPESKIILVLRNQIDIVKSQYRDHPFDPRNLYSNLKPVNIDTWVDCDFKNFDIGFLQSINYKNLVDFYSEIFGKENIGIFLFEELVKDLPSFSKKIANFLNINEEEVYKLLTDKHENKGVSKKYNSYRVFKERIKNVIPEPIKRNQWVKKIEKFINDKAQHGKRFEVHMSLATEKRLKAYFKESNQHLSVEYDLNLEKFGYL